MRKLIDIVTLTLVGLFSASFAANAQFTIDGQFRTRAEYRDGYKTLAQEATYATPLVLQRSRLILGYTHEAFTFKLSGQDARVWGQNAVNMAGSTTHIYEAWASYAFNPHLSVTVGRQELKYDDQRLMASKEFSLTGMSYDAALLKYNNKETSTSFHLGAMINNNGQDVVLTSYAGALFKYMTFVWFSKPLSDALAVNAINFLDVTQNTGDPHIMYARNTIGGNAIVNAQSLVGGQFGAYYQFGNAQRVGAFTSTKIGAYAFNASIWVKPANKLSVTATVDAYSGQDWSDATPSKKTSFNRLLNAGHAHLGFMDYFTSATLSEVSGAGLHNYFLRADYKVSEKSSVQATVNYFMLSKSYLPGGTKVDKGLGTEFDFVFNYKVAKSFAIQAAWMFMLPTETLEAIQAVTPDTGEFSHFAYISLNFTPNFLKWSKPVGE
ncbi:MAG: alginate export family protein [Bacteroidales bacterium]|nr:alginate export family protein [Bacteroidales bacterium]MBN2749017.1 alginate export family protein [Bacteroidales bacterium]